MVDACCKADRDRARDAIQSPRRDETHRGHLRVLCSLPRRRYATTLKGPALGPICENC
jgi:hypothetical protein